MLFSLRKEVVMGEPKKIYCPQCGRKITEYDGRGTMPLDTGCKKCRKRVVYYPEKDEVKITEIPPRTTASGTRFWF